MYTLLQPMPSLKYRILSSPHEIHPCHLISHPPTCLRGTAILLSIPINQFYLFFNFILMESQDLLFYIWFLSSGHHTPEIYPCCCVYQQPIPFYCLNSISLYEYAKICFSILLFINNQVVFLFGTITYKASMNIIVLVFCGQNVFLSFG